MLTRQMTRPLPVTMLVIALYILANVAYLCMLPLSEIQNAPDDRVGTAALQVLFGPVGAAIMAVGAWAQAGDDDGAAGARDRRDD